MVFTDDESRHDYHQAPLLLQVVCQVLEGELAKHSVQLELIDCEKHAGMWMAIVAPDDQVEPAAIDSILGSLNRMFARTDELETCVLENPEVSLISVRVTDSSDFAHAI